MNKDTRLMGTGGEDAALRYLESIGAQVIDKNFTLRDGEIDLIFKEKEYVAGFGMLEYVVFAEVKLRNTEIFGYPSEAVNLSKQRKIKKVSKYYLYTHDYPDSTPVRYDVISLEASSIFHIRNAFC